MDNNEIENVLARLENTLSAIPKVMHDFNDQVGEQMQRSFRTVQASLESASPEYLEALNSLLTLQIIFVNTLKKDASDILLLTRRVQKLEQEVDRMKADQKESSSKVQLLTDSLSAQNN